MIWRKNKSSKYGAVRTADGFPSKLESAVNQILHLRERAGEIRDVRRQVRVELTDAKIVYIADFRFEDLTLGEIVWAEAKGFETSEWRLKKRLWTAYGPGRLQIYKGTHGRPILSEELLPRRAGLIGA